MVNRIVPLAELLHREFRATRVEQDGVDVALDVVSLGDRALIADMYHLGLGVRVNTNKAFTLAEESSKEGSLFGTFLQAKFYIKGIGTNIDETRDPNGRL